MLSTNSLIIIALSTIALVLLGYGVARLRDYIRLVTQLEKRVCDLERCKPHDRVSRAKLDAAEALLFQISEAMADQHIATERILYARRMAQHIAAGGNPDDPPAKWTSSRERAGE
jgi:hypothetical protein